MSKNSGDKARFGKEQKKKMLRRKRTLALRQSLASTATTDVPGVPPTPSEPSVATLNQPNVS